LRVKRPGREADHSLPTSAEVKECVELYLHCLNTPSICGALLSTGATLPFTTVRFTSVLLVKISSLRSGPVGKCLSDKMAC